MKLALYFFYLNPFLFDIGRWYPNSEHIHASDKYILRLILVCSIAGPEGVNRKVTILISKSNINAVVNFQSESSVSSSSILIKVLLVCVRVCLCATSHFLHEKRVCSKSV